MNYTINESEFKQLGYTFQKLYASNYKCYWKQFGDYSTRIWCWVKGKQIEIDNWSIGVDKVLSFYNDSFKNWSIENAKLPSPRSAMKCIINSNTNEIMLKDMDEYFESTKSDETFDAYFKKYEDWRELNLFPELMKIIIDEINILTK